MELACWSGPGSRLSSARKVQLHCDQANMLPSLPQEWRRAEVPIGRGSWHCLENQLAHDRALLSLHLRPKGEQVATFHHQVGPEPIDTWFRRRQLCERGRHLLHGVGGHVDPLGENDRIRYDLARLLV